MDEQGIRLQSLHKAGEDLSKNVDKGDPAAKEINTQLKDFDDCWNDIAKQVINRIQQVKVNGFPEIQSLVRSDVVIVVVGRNWTLPFGLFRTNFTIFPIG